MVLKYFTSELGVVTLNDALWEEPAEGNKPLFSVFLIQETDACKLSYFTAASGFDSSKR